MRADGSEYACKLWRISTNNADLTLSDDEIIIRADDHIIAYVDNIGRLEGTVISVQRDDFTLQLIQTVHQKNKLAGQKHQPAVRAKTSCPSYTCAYRSDPDP